MSPWSNRRNRVAPLFESSLEDDDAAADDATTTTATAVVVEESSSDLADLAKSDLLETAKSLKDEFGCVLIDSGAQEKLTKVVETLESTAEPPADTSGLIGDWTLLCSTASASIGSEDGGPIEKQTIAGIDTSKLPFFNEGPIKEIRDRLNKSVKVEQLIKASDTTIDRVDHVVEYMPPDTLSEFLDTLPDAIKSLNINPLQVSESKVILVHKAEIESVIPSIKTKLSLQSVVRKYIIFNLHHLYRRPSLTQIFFLVFFFLLRFGCFVTVNVAGKSQILEPDGADVLGTFQKTEPESLIIILFERALTNTFC